MSSIANSARIHSRVRLGRNVTVGEWAIVGLPPDGMRDGEVETHIGDNAVIRSHTVVYAGSRIGSKFQTGHRAVVGPGMEIGGGCSIGTNTVTAGLAKLCDRARIHSLCYLDPFATLCDGAWVGPYAVIESSLERVTVIGAGAILALRVHLLPGVRIGERALVGTRCMVRKDVPPYRLVIGDPPRAVRSIDQIISPLAEFGRPYQADALEEREANLSRHAAREGCHVPLDDWRIEFWRAMQIAKSNKRRAWAPAVRAGDAPHCEVAESAEVCAG